MEPQTSNYYVSKLEHHYELLYNWQCYVNGRLQLTLPSNRTDNILKCLEEFDAKFLREMEANGSLTDLLRSKVADVQKNTIDEMRWEREKERRHRAAEENQERKQTEADQRFARLIRSEAESLILDLITAGVLHANK